MYAHSLPGRPQSEWESLATHSLAVARRAEEFAASFGWAAAAHVSGQLHDIGKAADATQAYLASPPTSGKKGPDHSTAGAREAGRLYGGFIGRALAYGIAGHHAGLADHAELQRRLFEKAIEPYDHWVDHIDELPAAAALLPTRKLQSYASHGFSQAFLIRMLFSCLVDADFLETQRFYTGMGREPFFSLDVLQERLIAYLEAKKRSDTSLNTLRTHILEHAVSKASIEPGMFTLTVPTGGGKTLTSLAFALEHARLHRLKRVIYVIPYTSIIEQTASVFREALSTKNDVLEHHASFDWDAARSVEAADDEGPGGLVKLRQAAENWDAPIVVTTAVQFFESLFANRPSRCRKLHNIAEAVVILDEAQTLPLRLLRPCMAALDELACNYRTSIVLCTATQPALRECDGFKDEHLAPRQAPRKIGFKIDDSRELAPDPHALSRTLKRVEIVWRPGLTTDADIVSRFAEQPQMLCIVNNRRHARELFDMLKADPRTVEGAYHLTTLMCPVHRRAVLAEVRRRLVAGLPVRLASTSLLEAGVDVDFPEVWRALAGLDSITQAAGRCNREGRLPIGQMVVFEPAERKPPPDFLPAIESTKAVFRRELDPLSIEGMTAYFTELYWHRGAEAMDAATLDKQPWPILDAIAERARECTFDFESMARAFRIIDDVQASVIVPYDADAERILSRVAAMELPRADDLRRLQQYSVSIPQRDRNAWLASGVLRPVHPRLADGLLRFGDKAHYREDTGVDLQAPERRDSGSNIF